MEQAIGQAISTLPEGVPWVVVALCIVVPALLAWGFAETVQKTWLNLWKRDHPSEQTAIGKREMWWSPLLILPSTVIGALTGFGIGMVGDGWGYGVFVGAGSGVVAAWIVKALKDRAMKLLGKVKG